MRLGCSSVRAAARTLLIPCPIRTAHTTYTAALKTTTHPKIRCIKPYAATEYPRLLMMGVCTRNMSSQEYINKITYFKIWSIRQRRYRLPILKKWSSDVDNNSYHVSRCAKFKKECKRGGGTFDAFPYTPNNSDTPLQYSAFETHYSCGSVCYGL